MGVDFLSLEHAKLDSDTILEFGSLVWTLKGHIIPLIRFFLHFSKNHYSSGRENPLSNTNGITDSNIP